MSIQVADNFEYKGTKPLDGRVKYATLALMKAASEATLYDGIIAYVDATDKYYKFLSSNTVDVDTGKWREFETGGSGGTSDYTDLSNKPQINSNTLTGNMTGSDLGLVDAETGKGLSTNDFTDALETKLNGIAAGAEVNVQANWNETDTDSDAYIKNKPTIPAAQVNSDWSASSGVAEILHKPTLGTAAAKDSTNAVTANSTDLVESGAVKTAIDNAVASAYHAAGTAVVADLTSSLLIATNEGNVYNMTDAGTTTADFIEGAGKPIRIGDNVGICKVGNDYKFDLLSGFVDTSNFIEKSSTAGLVKNDGTIDTKTYAESANAYQTGDTAETTLDDADYFPFYDTSATGKRKTLWSNIKSVLKTYFDNLYSSVSIGMQGTTGTSTGNRYQYIEINGVKNKVSGSEYMQQVVTLGTTATTVTFTNEILTNGASVEVFTGRANGDVSGQQNNFPLLSKTLIVTDGVGTLTLVYKPVTSAVNVLIRIDIR